MKLALGPRIARRAVAALALLAVASPARADLEDDASRIARSWAQRGAEVERLEPVFLERGRARSIDLEHAARADGRRRAAVDDASPGCLTVAVLSVRTAELFAGME